MLSSAASCDEILDLARCCVLAASRAPPSNDLPGATATWLRSRTRKDGSARGAFSGLSTVDLRLPKATGNLGIYASRQSRWRLPRERRHECVLKMNKTVTQEIFSRRGLVGACRYVSAIRSPAGWDYSNSRDCAHGEEKINPYASLAIVSDSVIR